MNLPVNRQKTKEQVTSQIKTRFKLEERQHINHTTYKVHEDLVFPIRKFLAEQSITTKRFDKTMPSFKGSKPSVVNTIDHEEKIAVPEQRHEMQ